MIRMNAYGWWLLLLLVSTCAVGVTAVDRSKFRTCQQTSFCRRHRGNHSSRLYEYKLIADSVHFHAPHEASSAEHPADTDPDEKEKKSVWQSLQRRLLGQHHVHNGDNGKLDPYVRGPPPTLTGTVYNVADETSSGSHEELLFSVSAMSDGLVRVRLTERYGVAGSAHEHARVTYDDLVLEHKEWKSASHAQWLRPEDPQTTATLESLVPSGSHVSNYMGLKYGDGVDSSNTPTLDWILLIQLQPFAVGLYQANDIGSGAKVVLNAEQMMHFETRRHKDGASEPDTTSEEAETSNDADGKKSDKEIVGYWEDGLAIYADGTREERQEMIESEEHRKLSEQDLDREGLWEEHFQSHQDSKPFGPMSVGMDIDFPESNHLYGIPEHASSATLKTTFGENAHFKEPYRLYNLDVFEYELDETMALYGNVPLVISQSVKTGTTGVFWFNPTETYVDIASSSGSTGTHWISESGIIDVFLLPGPDPSSVYHQYATLTGTTPTPPMFSLGYHQCRWNYKDEKDVYMVHGKFEELDYPYDVLWLDIEHTNGKRYFTWDSSLFPDPKTMQETLADQGRRMVTIVDPHILRDNNYYIHKEATAKGLYIKDKQGEKDYDGWCWPGSSSYLDFTDENVRSWWADQFSYSRYEGSTPTLFTWNDMNEPSVFNGPEVSMQKDLRNLHGDEHREWHNLYGMLFHRATGEGHIRRSPSEDIRPFVLSRAFFAGSQKYGAIWTGDNTADWGHLQVAGPMLLSLNTAALSFVGADVGGFFGNPDAELFTRWMQAGAYQPFFRGHAHHDSKRREPWMYGEETMQRLRQAALWRYQLLPFWYTVFHEAEISGMPVMRMMWMQYPETEAIFGVDDQYLIGADLLVKPITAAGVSEVEVLFPTDHLWYDVKSLQIVCSTIASMSVESRTISSAIDEIPVFQRGGSIIPRKLRLRRSTTTMKTDPYTLFVALDDSYQASGTLYMDDEETLGYSKRAECADASISADLSEGAGTVSAHVNLGSGWSSAVHFLAEDRMIERIVIMGFPSTPKAVSVNEESLDFSFNKSSNVLVVRKPEVSALRDWSIKIV
jgi:alpha 1,3-glucosidase